MYKIYPKKIIEKFLIMSFKISLLIFSNKEDLTIWESVIYILQSLCVGGSVHNFHALVIIKEK